GRQVCCVRTRGVCQCTHMPYMAGVERFARRRRIRCARNANPGAELSGPSVAGIGACGRCDWPAARLRAVVRPGSLTYKITQALYVSRGAVAKPAVHLGGLFELLAAEAWHGHISASEFGEGRHVSPELFKLSDRKDVFLAFAPALFDVLQSDV